jgi:hypothetical protein
VLKKFPHPQLALGLLCGLGLLQVARGQLEIANRSVIAMHRFIDSDRPFDTIREMNTRLVSSGVKGLYLVHNSDGVFPLSYVPHLLNELPFKNNWRNTWLENDAAEPLRLIPVDPEIAFLFMGRPPFVRPTQLLPGGWCTVSSQRATLLRVFNPNYGVQVDAAGKEFFWLGNANAEVEIFAPREEAVELSFVGQPGPGAPETPLRHLFVTQDNEQEHEALLSRSGERITLPLRLAAGRNTLKIRCVDTPSHPQPEMVAEGVVGALLVNISALNLQARDRVAAQRRAITR